MSRTLNLFEHPRMTLSESIDLTIKSLNEYGSRYRHWACAFSGGKDSSTLVTLIAHLLDEERIDPPESLTIIYADTRMELPPLQINALKILDELAERGIKTQVVLPELDQRYFVYMFGRGVPSPKNRFRWCTPNTKVLPMLRSLASLREQAGEKLLMLTGVRLGESANRDARIVMSCSRDGAECGQGWFQQATPEAIADTLAPILHWRVCNVWAWLTAHAPAQGFSSRTIARIYGGETEEAEEISARTGCIGCPLASRDTTLQRVVALPEWAYLRPLLRLKPLYTELTAKRSYRLRKTGETKKDGTLVSNPGRLGPLTMDARRYGLNTVLAIQNEVNDAARQLDRPEISLIDNEELERIEYLIAANTWPDRWTGEEIRGDELVDKLFPGGAVQPLLAGL